MPREQHGLKWNDEVTPAQIERWFIQQGGVTERDGKTYGLGLLEHFKAYWRELWPDDVQHSWTDLIIKTVLENQFVSLVGPACVAGHTRIPNPITGEALSIKELFESNTRPTVLTKLGPIVASVPWVKGFDELFEVRLANGNKFTTTGQHLVLTERGFLTVESLRQSENAFVLLPEFAFRRPWSTSEHVRSTHVSSALSLNQIVRDFRGGCHHEYHSCDEQLRWVSNTCQDVFPLQADALLYDAYRAFFHMGEGRNKPKHTLRDLQIYRLAISHNAHPEKQLGIHESHHYGEGNRELGVRLFQRFSQFPPKTSPLNSFSSQVPCSCRMHQNHDLAYNPSSDLLIPVTSIKYVGRDYFYDLTVPIAHHYFAEGAIHHNSSWKTSTVSRLALMDWSCFPECTTVIQSSTTMPDLKQRIYGETTKMWQLAKMRHPWFPGHPVDSKCVITNQDIDVELARDLRDSIVGVPCKASSGKFVGMSSYAGRKNRRVWCIGDEFQFMELSILNAQDNLVSNGPNLVPGMIKDKSEHDFGKPRIGYKCVFIGNTNPSRPGNPLDVVSEPEHGWGSIKEDGKTKVWKCKKLPNHPVQCVCINLDSKDSPNTPYPVDKPKYPRLAGPNMLKLYTEGSESYWSQGRGVFKFGLAAFKIITPEICEQFNAFQDLIWEGAATTKIGMVDASYGGGDRCPLGWLEFGRCVDGKIRIKFNQYWLIPVTVNPEVSPEYQIAMFTKSKMEEVGVPPENFFFDGRGSLAMAIAATWSPRVNAVEFGGPATNRPVGGDIYTIDKETKQRRFKLCNEHFSKFVTELWFSWLYATQADQIRNIPREIVADAHPREWYKVAGDKIEAEPKHEMKKRTGVSPDLADMCFSFNTLVLTPTGNIPIHKLKSGDIVVTPFGNTSIDKIRVRYSNKLTLVDFSNGTQLRGLGEHRVFCWEKGWERLDALSFANEIESEHNLPIWQFLNLLFTKDESTTFKAMVDIIRMERTVRLRDFYIELYGKNISEIFLSICASITKMVIGKITVWTIWSLLKFANTLAIMFQNVSEKIKSSNRGLLMPELSQQLSGMDRPMEGNGTAKTHTIIGGKDNQHHSFVKYADANSKPEQCKRRSNSALTHVSEKLPENALKLSALAKCVVKNLWHSNTMLRRIAPVAVHQLHLTNPEPLYDLTLSDHSAYYANGILVENCAVGIEGARRRGFVIGTLSNPTQSKRDMRWLDDLAAKNQKLRESYQLNFS